MTRANAAKSKAARLAAQRHTPVVDPEASQEPAAPVAARPPAVERKAVRVTVDLAPALYQDFEDWRRDAARELGRTRVKSVDVIRILLRELMASDADGAERSAAVMAALRREGST